MKSLPGLLSALLLLLLALPLIANSGSIGGAALTPTVEVATEMEVVPADCGILAEPIAIDPLIPQALGTWPIWVALPNWTDETKGILVVPNEHYHTHHHLEGWWATKVAWFIPLSYTGEVQLRGYNLADHSPIFFDFSSNEPGEVATLNPDQPGGYVTELDQWAFFPSHLWVSKAGCYRIEAAWEGGSWQQVIAVGSVEQRY